MNKVNNKLVDDLKLEYLLNKMKRWNRLTNLELDLANNEIDDDNYAEIIKILSDLDDLTKLNLSLWNNEISSVGFD